MELITDQLDKNASYNLAVVGIKDISPAENMLIGKVVKVNMAIVDTFPFKINFGGNDYAGYTPAQNRTPETAHGYMDGTDVTYPSISDIANTTDDPLYRSERKGLIKYSVRVDNGVYDIDLKFAESVHDSDGQRIFDIYVEGRKVISKLDIFAQVGKYAAHNVKIENVQISDEEINIHFTALVGETMINAMEIEQDLSGLHGSSIERATDYWIAQNYPNPFNAQTTFKFNMPVEGNVRLEVFDVRGTRISTLLEKDLHAGMHSFNYDFDIASGIYFYRFDVRNNLDSYQQTGKMILVR